MAGVVAMASSVIEDFETQPCKKPRKDGDTQTVKTITNYFMPMPKTVGKPFSPPRSNNIRDYFKKTPPVKEKSSSPQPAKEKRQQPPETLSSSESIGKQGKPPQKKGGRKPSRAAKRLPVEETEGPTEECVLIESSVGPVTETGGVSGMLGSDTAALLAQITSETCMDKESPDRKNTVETCTNAKKVKGRGEGSKGRASSTRHLEEEGTDSSPSTPARVKGKGGKSGVKNKKAKAGLQQQCVPEVRESEQSVCDRSLEENVEGTSRLNGSTITVSFQDFLQSQNQEEEERAVTPEPPADGGTDTLSVAKAGEDGSAEPSAPQVSPRTLTVQAEVHPISPDHEPPRAGDKKVASIFARSKREGNAGAAKAASSPRPPAGPESLPALKRRSNVVLLEEDLELAVVESSSAPKCSQAERKQFMNAFKQPGVADGAKVKASKSQGKPRHLSEKASEEEEEEEAAAAEEQEAAAENEQDQTSTEQKAQNTVTGTGKKRGRKPGRKGPKKNPEEVPVPTPETEDPVAMDVDHGAGSPDNGATPTGRGVRRSTRDLTPKSEAAIPLRETRHQEKTKHLSACQADHAQASTPKTHRSRKGLYRAVMLAPPDSKESPIRMKFTRVFPTSATKFGDLSEFEISSPLAVQESNASKKRKRAKKLVQKARALQHSKKAAAEDKAPVRRSARSQESIRRSYCEDEDSVVFLEEDQNSACPTAPDEGKSLKRLRSLNEVLGKGTTASKAAKNAAASTVSPVFLGKKPQKPSAVISIFDDSSRESSENSQDDEQFRARREFLKSGLPESFKKQIAKTAASRDAYTMSCASFQAVVHVQQRLMDCSLWSLPWPVCPLLSSLKEYPSPSKPLQSVEGAAVLRTVPAQRSSRETRSGWREDFSEPVRRCLLEEIRVSNRPFPVQSFFTRLLTRRADHLQSPAPALLSPEPDGSTKAPCGPATAEPLGGKRKRVEEGAGGKVAKKKRSSRTDAETIVIQEDSPAGRSGDGGAEATPDPETPRRGRRSCAQRRRQQEEKPKPAAANSPDLPQKDPVIVVHDSPSAGNAATEDGGKADLLWTEKYQPQRSTEVVGNTASVKKLHSWLKEWKLRADREERKKQQEKKPEGDSNDSWLAGEYGEGPEEGEDLLCNTLLITGPTGVGKTAAVYACAQELGFKVFEVNSSSQRSGRQILSQLKEATQSHQVDIQGVNAHKPAYFNSYSSSSSATKPGTSPRKVNSPRRVTSSPRKPPESPRGAPRRGGLAPASLATFFKMGRNPTAKDNQEKKAPAACPRKSAKAKEMSCKSKELPSVAPPGSKSTAEEQSKKTATSLILFEEVDVIFDDDSGFLAAIKTFMTTTKRPVILTTSDATFSAMFDGYFDEIHFQTPSLANAGSYLQLLCLAENVRTDARDVSSLLSWNRCDIRQSLLHLQFWARSGGGRPSHKPLPPPEAVAAAQAQLSGCAGGVEAAGGSAGEAVPPVAVPPCDSGCTESLLGFLNMEPHGDVQDLLKCESAVGPQSQRCWDLLAGSRRNGVDLLYSNMEALLPLPISTLPESVHRPRPESNPVPPTDPQPRLSEPFDDTSPVKMSSRMRRKKLHCLDDRDLFQSDSESDDGFLSLPKPDRSPTLTAGAGAGREGAAAEAAPARRRRRVALSATERKRSEPVSRCLGAMADFLDHMSFLDSSLRCGQMQAEAEGACRPRAFGWSGAEVKSGMTDEPRVERDGRGGSLEEVQVAVESLSFGRCRARVAEAWSGAQGLEEEVRREVVEELTLPVALHRQGFSLAHHNTLCQPEVLQRRRELLQTVFTSKAFGTLGNGAAAATDYLPTLRAICRSEQLKEQGKVKRRFLHYLDGIHLALPKSTVQQLAADFP